MANTTVGMILTAGYGTRLYPLTQLRPKPLMEIATRPILYFLIRMLLKASIKDIIFNVHHLSWHVRSYLENCGITARFHLSHEPHILGSAGGLNLAIKRFNLADKSLVLMHGDILGDLELQAFVDNIDFCTLICAQDQKISGYQGAVVADERGQIAELGRYYHSPLRAYRRGFFTGIQLLSPSALTLLSDSDDKSLVIDTYPRWLHEKRRVKAEIFPLHYDDLGTAERLWSMNMVILDHGHDFRFIDFFEGKHELEQGSGIFVGNNVRVHKSARLTGPIMIGDNVEVDEQVQLGPHAMIGDRVRIEAHAHVRNSVVMARTIIAGNERLNCTLAMAGARVLNI